MTQTANNYGTVLFELGVTKETVDETKKIFRLTEGLPRVLSCPAVNGKEKHKLIERIFPEPVHGFLKELCDHGHCGEIEDIWKAYARRMDEENDVLRAQMFCTGKPDDGKLAQIRRYLAGKYHKASVELEVTEQPALIGGFILRVGDMEEDFSIRGRLKNLEQKLTWR